MFFIFCVVAAKCRSYECVSFYGVVAAKCRSYGVLAFVVLSRQSAAPTSVLAFVGAPHGRDKLSQCVGWGKVKRFPPNGESAAKQLTILQVKEF
jgi:hypothetical protein